MLKRRNFKAEDVQLSTFENTQVILWQTQYEVHDFAYCMNRLYGLQLAREQNYSFLTIEEKTVDCPNYLYYDESKQLFYILVDNGIIGSTVVPELESYDKVMFIYGRDSKEQCMLMYEEFTGHVMTNGEGDLLGEEHKELIEEVANNGVIDVDYFCFAEGEQCETSVVYFMNVEKDSKAGKRFDVFKKELGFFLDGLERKISMDEMSAMNDDNGSNMNMDNWVIG